MLNPMAHAMPNDNTLIVLENLFYTPCQSVLIPDVPSGFETLALVAFARLPPPRRIA
jgi:hypothetical protein